MSCERPGLYVHSDFILGVARPKEETVPRPALAQRWGWVRGRC